MSDVDITWLLLVIICILLILCCLLYLSNGNNQSSISQYAADVRDSFNSFLSLRKKGPNDSAKLNKQNKIGDNELFNGILNEKQSEDEESVLSDGDDDNGNTEDSEDETNHSVIDYETYNRVCEDYRKTTLALKERENEVATLMKENETKSLTIKMLKDKLLSYGTTTMEKTEEVPDSKAIIEQQKEIIQSLLAVDGNTNNIDKLLTMYESKVKELAEAKQQIEQMKVDYSQFNTLQKKGELVDKLMIENEALRARIRMDMQTPSYSFTPMAGYPYPVLPPGFGYSQNTSVTDGNSVGMILEEDHDTLSHGQILTPQMSTADGMSTASQSSLQKVRTLKLKNKVYFQLVEATNAIQKAASKRGGTISKLSSASITKIARYVRDIESMSELKKRIVEIIPCIQLCTDSDFSDYVNQLRIALSKQ